MPSPSPLATLAPATPGASNGVIPAPIGCADDRPCSLAPGTYVLTGEHAFLSGLTLTLPVSSTSGENGLGGFDVTPGQAPGGLMFWKDLTPVTPDGKPLSTIDRSAKGITEWLSHDSDFVMSKPLRTVIGNGIPATTFLLGVSKSATNADPDCPVQVCVAVMTDADHWQYAYAIGRQPDPLYFRLYLADIVVGAVPHTLVVGLDAGGAAGLSKLQPMADSILKTVRLPPDAKPA